MNFYCRHDTMSESFRKYRSLCFSGNTDSSSINKIACNGIFAVVYFRMYWCHTTDSKIDSSWERDWRLSNKLLTCQTLPISKYKEQLTLWLLCHYYDSWWILNQINSFPTNIISLNFLMLIIIPFSTSSTSWLANPTLSQVLQKLRLALQASSFQTISTQVQDTNCCSAL